jgi:hypothetical protein
MGSQAGFPGIMRNGEAPRATLQLVFRTAGFGSGVAQINNRCKDVEKFSTFQS